MQLRIGGDLTTLFIARQAFQVQAKDLWTCCYRRFFRLVPIVLFSLLLNSQSAAQDYSNKGKDFWITFPAHIDGTTAVLGIYITSDVAASGQVTVAGTVMPFSITPNTVETFFLGNNTTPSNTGVYLSQSDGIKPGAGIHITSNQNIVVYGHIIRSARSGASLILPTNVWGKEYLVPSYSSSSGPGASPGLGEIAVVAKEKNTTIEITPVVNTLSGKPAGVPFTVTLANPGDVYQVQFEKDADISGTLVKSVAAAGEPCKPIAVFSASTWSAFNCGGSSGDNLYQQLFPMRAFGRNFLTAPFLNRSSDIIRVFVTDPATVVTRTINGVTTVLTGLTKNTFYEYETGQPSQIQASKPVSVVQYITTQTCKSGCINNNNPACYADPEMILLNPVEQTINNITVFSAHRASVPANQSNVDQCYLNIIIKTSVASSFKINGQQPAGVFIPIPGTAYSYLQENVTALSAANPVQTLSADSSFSAIAYGFGNVESYGYNAGTNVKDLYQYITVKKNNMSVNFPATCLNVPSELAISLPYAASHLKWLFYGKYPDVDIAVPVPDSTYILDGKTIYRYPLPGSYLYNTLGTYQLSVIATNPMGDGCGNDQQIDFAMEVFDKPAVKFSKQHNGCLPDAVQFTDASPMQPRPIVNYHWNFGDGTTSTDKHPLKQYNASGTYTVKETIMSDVGCINDSSAVIQISDMPMAAFSNSAPLCTGTNIVFTDNSTIGGGNIVRWYWDYGNGKKDTLANNTARNIVYANTGTYTVQLVVESASGCRSAAFTKNITILPAAVPDFTTPQVACLPDGRVAFTNRSTIADGTAAQLQYAWDFGDGTTDNTPNPTHRYASVGPFTIKLNVTSAAGCQSQVSKLFDAIFLSPKAGFDLPLVCVPDPATFNNTTTIADGTDNLLSYTWSFGLNNASSAQKNPVFAYPSVSNYTVKLKAVSNKGCVDSISKTFTNMYAKPVADFIVNPTDVCLGSSIAFSAKDNPMGQTIKSYSWMMDDNNTLTTKDLTYSYQNAGTYAVQHSFSTVEGCQSNIAVKNVNVYAYPVVDAGPDITVLLGGKKQLNAVVSGSRNYSYNWTPATWLNNTSVLKPFTSPQSDIVYTLTATAGPGCSNSDQVQVMVKLSADIPTAFSPNNDGINDVWNIRYLDSYPDLEMRVFDRYGRTVFNCVGYNKPWNGKINGQDLPVGVYYYIIEPKNGLKPLTGSVTIVR